MPEGNLSTMAIPGQRITDLESGAWQTEKRLERIDLTLAEMNTKLDQHAFALSSTMQDLRDLRIDVHGLAKTQRSHTALLTAIAEHLGVSLPTLDLEEDETLAAAH